MDVEQLVSANNIDRWVSAHGAAADNWLAELPDITAAYAQDWNLAIGKPLEGGSASVVVGATQGDAETVLKIHPPWAPVPNLRGQTSASIEATALKILGDECAPRLLASDKRALLLERIMPGTAPLDMSAEQAATLITQISKPVLYHARVLPTLYEMFRDRYKRGSNRLHPDVSCDLYNSAFFGAAVLSCVVKHTLVHGDLKPKNVLCDADGSFKVIDLVPAVGSAAYDAATWAIDKPTEAIGRCAEIADWLKVNPKVIGSWALVLAIPETCLVSEKRAAANLEFVRELTGTSDLESYFADRLLYDVTLAS